MMICYLKFESLRDSAISSDYAWSGVIASQLASYLLVCYMLESGFCLEGEPGVGWLLVMYSS